MAAQKFGLDARTPLLISNTRSHATLDAETVKALSGRAAWLYEFASGDVAGGTDQEPITPLTPSGRVGHDHSGPPYGSAIQHPLWLVASSQTLSQFTRDNGTNNYESATAWVTDTANPLLFVEFYCRPFPEYEGSPYSRCYVYADCLSVAGTEVLTLETWNTEAPDLIRSDTATISDTAWAPTTYTFPDAYLDVRPGWNRHACRFSASANGVAVYGVSGSQIVRRSH